MDIRVRELMTADVVTMRENQTIEEAKRRLSEKSIHALPVVGGDKRLVGIITKSDLVGQMGGTEVRLIMSSDLKTVGPDDHVTEATAIMEAHHVHHVPVVEGETLVGIVSSFDLLKLVDKLLAQG